MKSTLKMTKPLKQYWCTAGTRWFALESFFTDEGEKYRDKDKYNIEIERVKEITGKGFRFYKIDLCEKEELSKVFEENKIDAVMQDIQFHPVSDKILHVDFFQLHPGKEISMVIPVRVEGTAPGVRDSGGLLSRNKRKLTVRALPKNLPDFLLADVSTLKLNDSITVADLSEDTFSILHPDNQVVCQVKMSRASMSIEEETDEELEEGAEGAEGAEGTAPSENAESGKEEAKSE